MIAIALTHNDTSQQSEEFQMVSCDTCPFFHRTTAENPDVTEPEGECRASLPAMGSRSEKRWPEVSGDDWCGAHPGFEIAESIAGDDGDDDSGADDLADGLLDDTNGPPAEEINGGVPKYDDPNRPLEPLDVVLMDNLDGVRGVIGFVQRVPPDSGPVIVMIAGNAYPIARHLITQRLCRMAPAKV